MSKQTVKIHTGCSFYSDGNFVRFLEFLISHGFSVETEFVRNDDPTVMNGTNIIATKTTDI